MWASSDDLYTYRMTVAFADGRASPHCCDDPHWFIAGQHQQSTCGHPGFNLNFASGVSGSGDLSQRQFQVVFHSRGQAL